MIWQLLVNGLIAGSLYALFALILFFIFNTTRVLLVATGAIFVLMSHSFTLTVYKLKINYSAALGINVLLGLLLLYVSFKLIHYPLAKRGADAETHLIASLGMMIILENITYWVFGEGTKELVSSQVLVLGNVYIKTIQVVSFFCAISIFAIAGVILRRTWFGKTLRGVASNADLSVVLGVNERLLSFITFLFSSIILALLACLITLDVGVESYSSMNFILPSVIGAIFGGLNDFKGIIVGSFIVGLLMFLLLRIVPHGWQVGCTYFLVLLILVYRRRGIFGGRLWQHDI